MKIENILAKRIDTAGQNASYDSYCKRLLANKQILAWILKTCVPEFKIIMTKTMEREAIEMCNLSQGIIDRTLINAIISMMRNSDMSEEECMKMLDIPEEQREMYHMMLQEKLMVSQT